MARHAGPRRGERGRHRDRSDARLRHRVECFRAGHRLRGRCRTRAHPHQSSRGHSRPGHLRSHLSQPRGSAALSGVPRSHPRLRHLSLRPEEAALHQAALAAAVSGRRADRTRDPRHRQQRRRAALDPRRHASPSSIATRPNTASASTTTSTPSICRPRPAPRVVPRVRPSSTSRAASSRSTPVARPAPRPASIYRWAA